MNTDNNERFKETEEKIIKAYGTLSYNKKTGKITVNDICKEAGIHRTTFYGHYQDILELEYCVTELEFQKFLNGFVTEDGWDLREGFLFALNFLYNHQPLTKRIFLVEGNNERIDTLFSRIIKTDLAHSYLVHFNLTTELEMDYHQSFLIAGHTAIIKKWALSNFRESPEHIADIMCRLMRVTR